MLYTFFFASFSTANQLFIFPPKQHNANQIIVEILKNIASSPKLQKLLQETQAQTKDIDDAKKIKKYVNEIRDVGCRDISISYHDDLKNASILFKLIEKCKRVEEENKSMEENLAHRRAKVENENIACDAELVKTLALCREAKLTAMNEYAEKEKLIEKEMKILAQQHEGSMNCLQRDLASIQNKKVDETEEEVLQNRIEETQLERERTNRQHKLEIIERQEDIKKMESNLRAEIEEKNYLQLRYALIQSNKDIAEKENRLLQQVMDLEAKADGIMFNAAVGVQKIFRGTRDRKIVRKIKGKKSKKGKKKGNGKK